MNKAIKLTDSQLSLFKTGNIAHVINPKTLEEEVYYYFPYYIKKVEGQDYYELISPEKLPKYVCDLIKKE